MQLPVPPSLAIIAGKGVYPRLVAESARKHGVARVLAIAFRRETDPAIEKAVDETRWIYLGQFGHMLEALAQSGIRHVVMAGQITPTHLFRLRLDAKALSILKRLRQRNAHTIFGAVCDEVRAIGAEMLPASAFMEDHMPAPGLLSRRAPTERERLDIDLGMRVARATSGLEIGQTVVVKEGTILAVEAFEGTDATILRAGDLGGPGAVVVKVAKTGHDMRFDIPVVGLHTMKVLRKVKAAALAVEAGRSILLEREAIIEEADRLDLCLAAVGPAAEPDRSTRKELTQP
jgi:UDP-2,3-diacylglucosamine hydrolase